jgi:hypothetical protein
MRSLREAYRILVANVREKATLEDLGTDGRIILKLYVKKRGVYRINQSRGKCVSLWGGPV